MTYQEALEYIHTRPRFTPERASIRMEQLLGKLGHPEQALSFVHVTGTNGKGSVSAMLAGMLRAAGKKTGLFISPYILEFRERIQINGEMIPQGDLARLVGRLRPAIEEMEREGGPVNEFMTVTALGMLWFLEQRCDMVVLEVGIGGFHDATNCIPAPRLSVIMGIGLDHTAILGSTIEEVARDKSGIIKGNPAVLYPEQDERAAAVIMERCAETGSTLTIPSLSTLSIQSEDFTGTAFTYGGTSYTLPLIGRYQVKNAVTAITGAQILGLPEEAIREGLAHVHFPVRMEVVRHDPIVILDGAHNVHGMTALRESILPLKGERKLTAAIGMMRDKDFADALAVLAPVCDRMVTVTVDYPRTAQADEIAAAAAPYCDDITPFADWKDGLSYALAQAKAEDGLLLCCGSLFLAADTRKWFAGRDNT